MFKNAIESSNEKIAVVIPTYRAKDTILTVLDAMPACVQFIYVVDDCCPQQTGAYVKAHTSDSRVSVMYHDKNAGVGGATMTGYRQALADEADIVVKIDSDNQMDPQLIPQFIAPIIAKEADYCKGNRFYDLNQIQQMPKIRIFGNVLLSFLTKFSSGYWKMFDPTNGYTAISRAALERLPLEKISERYFFESDMLFRLYLIRAVVLDVAMDAKYADEKSHLSPLKVLPEFLWKNCKNICKRIGYTYFLRDFNMASLELSLAVPSLIFGFSYGLVKWIGNSGTVAASSGEVMLAALPIIIGTQLLLGFLNFDALNFPNKPLVSSYVR